GLAGQREQVAQRIGRVGWWRNRARPAALLERRDHVAEPGLLRNRCLVARARLLYNAPEAALGLLEIRVHELGLDRLAVCERVDRRERVIGGLRLHARERAEQRRLAGVRQPDDADLHERSSAHATPSAKPATVSDGQWTPR